MKREIHMEVNYKGLDFWNVISCSLTGKCQASTFRAAKGDTISQLKQATSNVPFEAQKKKVGLHDWICVEQPQTQRRHPPPSYHVFFIWIFQCVIRRHTFKTRWKWTIVPHSFNVDIRWKRVVSLVPRGKSRTSHRTRAWVDPKTFWMLTEERNRCAKNRTPIPKSFSLQLTPL